MKVFVAGATGVLGRRVVPELLARGHSVVALSRSAENERAIEAMGARAVRADLVDAASLAPAMEGCDVAVRLATHIAKGRARAADWAANDRIRRDGTRAMLEAARGAGVRRYVQESILWVDASGVTTSALEAERLAAAARIDAATLRLGWLYGADTAHTRQFAEALRKRRLPVVSPGTAPLAFLHTEDAGRAFANAIEGSATGVFDVCEETLVPSAAFFDAFAVAIGAPRPIRVPPWVARLGAGAFVVKLLTTPMRGDPRGARAAFGWSPRYAATKDGLAEVAASLTS